MLNTKTIKKTISDISDCIDYLSSDEIANYLHGVSFDYDFIMACSEYPAIDELLCESIGHANQDNLFMTRLCLDEICDILD